MRGTEAARWLLVVAWFVAAGCAAARRCPSVLLVASRVEEECAFHLPILNSGRRIVRVYYVSTAGVEQMAYDLEPGVRYVEKTACPGDVWRARSLDGLLLEEFEVDSAVGETFLIRPCDAPTSSEGHQSAGREATERAGFFAVLNMSSDAGFEAVQKAYRRLALVHHPDRGGHVQAMREISEAYTALSSWYQCHD